MSSKLLFVAALAGASLATAAAAAPSVEGDWIVEDRSGRVRIAPCKSDAARLCGTIVAMPRPNDASGQPLRDVKNPDAALRSRTILGLPLITGFKPSGAGKWDGGKIYNPQDGKTYASKLELAANGSLKVSGCVLVICKAQTWTRAN
jgi:uncharacterized protein (DUF2147 family)